MTDRLGVAEQAFRGHDDERLAEVAFHLTPDEMKMLRGSGGVDHLHVVVGAEGEESLQSGAGMLGSGPLVAVGEEAGQSRESFPFGFGGGDELVEDDLRAVGKVTELRLPDHQHVRIAQ